MFDFQALSTCDWRWTVVWLCNRGNQPSGPVVLGQTCDANGGWARGKCAGGSWNLVGPSEATVPTRLSVVDEQVQVAHGRQKLSHCDQDHLRKRFSLEYSTFLNVILEFCKKVKYSFLSSAHLFRKTIAFSKVPRLRPFVLLVRATCK